MVKVEAATGTEPDAVRRLGALGVWVAEDAERLTQRLRLANAESDRLLALEDWWRIAPRCRATTGACAALSARAAIVRRSRSHRLVAVASRCGGRKLAGAGRSAAALDGAAFPLKAADFTRRGVAAGPALGVALRAAEAAWIAADFPLDQATLEAIADRAVQLTTSARAASAICRRATGASSVERRHGARAQSLDLHFVAAPHEVDRRAAR